MKNSYLPFLVFLYLLIYSQCSLGQNSSFTDKYNLNFNLPNTLMLAWQADPDAPFVLRQDSSQTIHGKSPLCFAQAEIWKMTLRMKGTIQQRILLPQTQADSAIVSLNCKSKNLLYARLIISGLDNRESILYSDTLSVLGPEEWKIFSRPVFIKDVAFLHLNIEVLGGLNIKDAKGKFSTPEQRLHLDKIELKIEGKDINDFPLPSPPIIPDIKKSDIISLSLSDSNSFNKISELANKRIVAIGETIHGSETIVETAVQLIKHRVENNHCKLILLEIPTAMSLQWNRYIQGDTMFKIETLLPDLQLSLFSPRVIIDLLNWLKQYNEKVKDKVWLLGMDIPFSSFKESKSLYDYVSKINENKKNILLDTLCSKIYNNQYYPQALQLLDKNNELENIIGKNECEILKYCLTSSIATKGRFIKIFTMRDNQMHLNVAFLLNLLCPSGEKATIYTHFLHANYITMSTAFPFSYSFGSYMKKKFGNDYYSIALLTGGGSFRIHDRDSLFVKRKLEIAPENSLEDLFMRTHEELCFIPISTLPSQLAYMRTIGRSYLTDQFDIIAPSSRMDAAIFVRNSKAFDLLPGSPLTVKESSMFNNKQMDDYFKRYREKHPIAKKNIKAVL